MPVFVCNAVLANGLWDPFNLLNIRVSQYQNHLRKARKAESSKSLDSRHADILMTPARNFTRCAELWRPTTISSRHCCWRSWRLSEPRWTRRWELFVCQLRRCCTRTDIKDLVVYSTDVVNMYPKLDINQVADIVAEARNRSWYQGISSLPGNYDR